MTWKIEQHEPRPEPLAQKILALVNQCDGLKVALSGKREDIVQFWQNLHDIKQLCQEELQKE